jgi:formylglycine-generating enzyme required for sulfatase activity
MSSNRCPRCFGDLPKGQPSKCQHCGSDIHWGGGKAYRTRLEANNATRSESFPPPGHSESMTSPVMRTAADAPTLDEDTHLREQVLGNDSAEYDDSRLGFFDRCLLFCVSFFHKRNDRAATVDHFLAIRRKIYFSWQSAKQIPAFLLWFVLAVFAAVAVFLASILAPQFLQPHAVRAFNTITVLTESVAKELSQFAGDEIDLSRVKSLDSSAARELAKWRGVSLNLSGLESVDQNAAAQLATWRGQTLDLSGLKNLPPPAAKSLAKWPGKFLRLAGLKTMPLNSARELAECRVASLDLLGLVSAGDEILAILRVNPGISLPQVPALNEGRRADDLQKSVTNSIGMKLNRIPAGTFTMGEGDQAHRVTLTKPFFIGVTEVTNAQWKAVMRDVPSKWKDDERPVEQVSWDDAVSFCKKLSSLPAERAVGRVYRLPTEAEWECACRAGSTTAYSFGDHESLLGIFAWFSENAGKQTHTVGKKQPNAWGLHDMHGNAWEWCSDWYDDYPRGSVTNPHGPASGSHRVNRGGCWYDSAWRCRSASRGSVKPSYRHYFLGFRLALSPSGSKLLEEGQ